MKEMVEKFELSYSDVKKEVGVKTAEHLKEISHE